MKQLQKVFEYSGVTVRTQVVNDEPWFCLIDVGAVLQMTTPANFLKSKYCDEEGVVKFTTPSEKGEQETTFINEPNLYAIIMRSTKEEAVAFRKYVTHEVLPELRKTGSYVVENSKPAISTETDPILAQLQVLQDMRQSQLSTVSRVEDIEERVKRLESRREDAKLAMLSLPAPTVEARELTERENCVKLVENISRVTGISHHAVWNTVYRDYEKIEGILITARMKGEKWKSKVEWIEAHGKITVLYSILRKMFVKAMEDKREQAS